MVIVRHHVRVVCVIIIIIIVFRSHAMWVMCTTHLDSIHLLRHVIWLLLLPLSLLLLLLLLFWIIVPNRITFFKCVNIEKKRLAYSYDFKLFSLKCLPLQSLFACVLADTKRDDNANWRNLTMTNNQRTYIYVVSNGFLLKYNAYWSGTLKW